MVKHVELRACGAAVLAPLRLRTTHGSYGEKTSFDYLIDIDEPGVVRVSHADPNEVCRLAEAALVKLLAIVWKPHFMVEVRGLPSTYSGKPAPRDVNEAEFAIQFELVEMGERAGQPVWRRVLSIGGYGPVNEGDPVGPGDNGVGVSSALVPATEESRAKLEAVVAAVHELRDRAADMLRPETIAASLKDLRVLALPVGGAEGPRPRVKATRSKGRRK